MRWSSIGKEIRDVNRSRVRYCEHTTTDSEKSEPCKERIYVTCPHCQRWLCLFHINEHQRLLRSLFDSLVNRLNEYRYQLTVTLRIQPDDQTLVNDCLHELRTCIIPYVQKTCCENDVKQEDLNRLQIFIDKMQNVVDSVQYRWNQSINERKRPRTPEVKSFFCSIHFHWIRSFQNENNSDSSKSVESKKISLVKFPKYEFLWFFRHIFLI